MTISTKDIISLLSEWPERPAGSEDEMMAREAIMVRLMGEYGIDVKEEGIYAPPNLRAFVCVLGVALLIAFGLFALSNVVSIILLGLIIYTVYAVFTGRGSPLVTMLNARITANLIAVNNAQAPQKIALIVPFDSYQDQFSCYLPPQFGEGREHYKTTLIAASVAAATRLWKTYGSDAEIRLCLLSGSVAGQVGAHQFIKQHKTELLDEQIHVFGLHDRDLMPFMRHGIQASLIDTNEEMTPTSLSNHIENKIAEYIAKHKG
ncbi:hypothetical protein [Kordiimonas sp. SCSIO 12610]|uniref:hypothetical protein n=1 Tax=Kordiimonas sp. SCSIO 12610 TaxID=2829597 RepID=UPI002108BA4F|nr:hypothetical protein [Kordiimonas sp. SCSIO 12610]UTW53811.1 hypothetical protein KFF44_08115 [Kordiimonas sp. SCSIO 12610]